MIFIVSITNHKMPIIPLKVIKIEIWRGDNVIDKIVKSFISPKPIQSFFSIIFIINDITTKTAIPDNATDNIYCHELPIEIDNAIEASKVIKCSASDDNRTRVSIIDCVVIHQKMMQRQMLAMFIPWAE